MSVSTRGNRTVIIGGGIVGITAAFKLSSIGHSVTVLESNHHLAAETSFLNGALVCPSLMSPWANSHVIGTLLNGIKNKYIYGTQPVVKVELSSFLESSFRRFLPLFLSQCTVPAESRNNDALKKLAALAVTHMKQIIMATETPTPETTTTTTTTTTATATAAAAATATTNTVNPSLLSSLISVGATSRGSLSLISTTKQMSEVRHQHAQAQAHAHAHAHALAHAQKAKQGEEKEDEEDTLRLLTRDECVDVEPALKQVILENVEEGGGGLYSDRDTNGDIHSFCNRVASFLRSHPRNPVTFVTNAHVHAFHVTETTATGTQINHRVTSERPLSLHPHSSYLSSFFSFFSSSPSPSPSSTFSVHGIEVTGGRCFPCDVVVVATGNHVSSTCQMLGADVPVYPVKGYVVEVPAIREREGEGEGEGEEERMPSVNIVDDAQKLYISRLRVMDREKDKDSKAKPSSVFRISGYADFSGFADIGKIKDPDRAHSLLTMTAKWLPNQMQQDNATFHTCSRPCSPDDVPYVGRLSPCLLNAYVVGGLGSKGWTLAGGTAYLLEQAVRRDFEIDNGSHGDNKVESKNSNDQVDLTPYDPRRFESMSSLAAIFRWIRNK